MRTFVLIALILGALHATAGIAQDRTDAKSLYDSHRWFDLHHLSFEDKDDLLYKAATEMAFHQEKQANEDINRYVASHPTPTLAIEAHELLLGAAFRNGRYQEALFQAQQILALNHEASDVINFLPTLQVLAPFGRQATVSRRPSTVRMELLDQNLVLPVTIGKETSHYILDNGFSLSGMSESEAQRLRLPVKTVATRIDTMSGAPVDVRIAVVPILMLGGLKLRNVAFYVLSDHQPPFNELPPGHRGILGLQVFLALEHFSWQPQYKMFSILRNALPEPSDAANLAFDGSSIFAQLSFRSTPIQMSLDSGAQNTVLYPSFAQEFPEIASSASSEQQRITGVGGSASIQSWTLPVLIFELGGRSLTLKPATVLLKGNNSTSEWFQGNLGMNLLNQANNVDINFASMTIALQ